MGGTHYFVLRQGDGRIFVASLHFTRKSAHVYIFIATFNRILHTSGVAMLGHTGARALATRGGGPPVQVSMRIVSRIVDCESGAKWS